MVLFRTSPRTALIIRLTLLVLTLLSFLFIRTDSDYCDWGYVVHSSQYCTESYGMWGFRVFGILLIINTIFIIPIILWRNFILKIAHKIASKIKR